MNHLPVLLAFFLFSACSGKTEKKPEAAMAYQENLQWHPVTVSYGNASETGFELEKALPPGYVKDGSEDYTAYIQSAIFNHDRLIFPAFPLKINESGLRVNSNKALVFPKGSELRLAATDKGKYAVLDIRNARNVELFGPVIVGDRDKHLGEGGEWGMGINIVSSENVSVYNAKVTNCWGDGIYIAGSSERGPSRNIKIVNAYCRQNRRNGISVINVDGLELISPYSGYNEGVDPQCGIDIEPNKPGDQIRNIRIVDARTEYNPGAGISIGVNKLYGSGNQQISVDIQKPVDYGSMEGLLISCSASRSKNGEKVGGTITVTDPVWKYNANTSLSVHKLREPALQVQVKNADVTDPKGKPVSREAFHQQVQATLRSPEQVALK
ncbi:MAG TPA: right-handed parallel beta-helix repeat-containing protein [Sphingobacteriaceae bacterium]